MFNPSDVFRSLYRQYCIRGIHDYATTEQLNSESISTDIEAQIISMFSHIKYGGQSAATLRQRSLEQNTKYWSLLKPTVICLICLQRNLEHYLTCGHAMCDICVARFGAPTKGKEYRYDLTSCPICQREIQFQARLLPPTCRVRFLGIDGGGSRGIVSLKYMAELHRILGLSYPLQEHFDYNIGTSSGKASLDWGALG